MKKLNEYLDNSNSLFMKELYATYPVLRMFIGEIVLSAQKDAYNQAIEDVMMNARVKKMFLSTGDYSGYDKYIIDKDSILKLKIK